MRATPVSTPLLTWTTFCHVFRDTKTGEKGGKEGNKREKKEGTTSAKKDEKDIDRPID
jgi:hypothetical protein